MSPRCGGYKSRTPGGLWKPNKAKKCILAAGLQKEPSPVTP